MKFLRPGKYIAEHPVFAPIRKRCRSFALITHIASLQRGTMRALCIFLIYIFASMYHRDYHPEYTHLHRELFMFFMIPLFVMFMVSFLILPQILFQSQSIMEAIENSDDVSQIGSFIDALYVNISDRGASSYPENHQAGKTIMLAIIRLMRQMRYEDAYLLNQSQRAQLYKFLSPGIWNMTGSRDYYLDFALQIVTTLETLGMRDSLPVLRRLANSANSDADLREAARKCLTKLEERFAKEGTSTTLLRPSVPAMAPDILLRPAANMGESAPEVNTQLLRPAVEQDHIEEYCGIVDNART